MKRNTNHSRWVAPWRFVRERHGLQFAIVALGMSLTLSCASAPTLYPASAPLPQSGTASEDANAADVDVADSNGNEFAQPGESELPSPSSSDSPVEVIETVVVPAVNVPEHAACTVALRCCEAFVAAMPQRTVSLDGACAGVWENDRQGLASRCEAQGLGWRPVIVALRGEDAGVVCDGNEN